MMKRYAAVADDDNEILSDKYILEAICNAREFFEMALQSTMLEEALDGSKKTSSGKTRESLKMLADMERDFEQLISDY